MRLIFLFVRHVGHSVHSVLRPGGRHTHSWRISLQVRHFTGPWLWDLLRSNFMLFFLSAPGTRRVFGPNRILSSRANCDPLASALPADSTARIDLSRQVVKFHFCSPDRDSARPNWMPSWKAASHISPLTVQSGSRL